MTPVGQLSLRLGARSRPTFANFVGDANAAAVAALRGTGNVWLWGPPGSGRTHLLLAAVDRVPGARYLKVAQHGRAELLPGLEGAPLVALDDLDEGLPQRSFEVALVHLIDVLRHRGARLMCAARTPPGRCDAALPDLLSRCSAAAVFRLQAPGDQELAEILLDDLRRAGLQLDAAALKWLMRRGPRNPTQLRMLAEEIRDGAVAAQREVTVPFLRDFLGERLMS